MVSNITEMSYRETAEKITEMTGQSISAMGVWNVCHPIAVGTKCVKRKWNWSKPINQVR